MAARGVEATSDGDVLAHAAADALLGAAALGDLGALFPSDDPRWRGADSMALLAEVAARVAAAGYRVSSLDATVIAERVRVAPASRGHPAPAWPGCWAWRRGRCRSRRPAPTAWASWGGTRG